MVTNSLVAAQQLGVRQLEPREDGRRAKRRARLPLAVVAVADVQCQGLLGRRLEANSSALAAGVHGHCLLSDVAQLKRELCCVKWSLGGVCQWIKMSAEVGRLELVVSSSVHSDSTTWKWPMVIGSRRLPTAPVLHFWISRPVPCPKTEAGSCKARNGKEDEMGQ